MTIGKSSNISGVFLESFRTPIRRGLRMNQE